MLGLPRSNHYTHPSAFFKVYVHRNIHITDLLPFAPETTFNPLFFLVVKSFCNSLKRQDGKGRVPPLDPTNPFSLESRQIHSDVHLHHSTAARIYVWLSANFLGYENSSSKRANKKKGERKLTEQ